MTAMLSGAEMVVQSLIEESVEQIFGYPGGSVLDIYDALHAKTDQIKHVLVRHEQAATHMADGYARATGKPGVVSYWYVLVLVQPIPSQVLRLHTWIQFQ